MFLALITENGKAFFLFNFCTNVNKTLWWRKTKKQQWKKKIEKKETKQQKKKTVEKEGEKDSSQFGFTGIHYYIKKISCHIIKIWMN